jgi:hypothetical protein
MDARGVSHTPGSLQKLLLGTEPTLLPSGNAGTILRTAGEIEVGMTLKTTLEMTAKVRMATPGPNLIQTNPLHPLSPPFDFTKHDYTVITTWDYYP